MNKSIIKEIKEWERIWGLNISISAEDDLATRIEIIKEENEGK